MEFNILLLKIADIILIIGGLSLGLVGLLGIDLVARVFGSGSVAARAIYILVGIAALYVLLVMAGVIMIHPAPAGFSIQFNS